MRQICTKFLSFSCVSLVVTTFVAAFNPAIAQDSSKLSVTNIGTVGVLSGDGSQEFGHIIDLAVGSDSALLYVLDALNSRLSIFSANGDFLASTGSAGGGPGEFRHPRALSVRGDSVFVFDPGLLRLSTFVYGGNTIVHVDDHRLPVQGWDMCMLGDQLYILKYHQGSLIQQVGMNGEIVRSFGRPFRQGDDFLAGLTDMGHLACDAVDQSIFVAAHATPVLRRYTPSGKMMWEVEVPGAEPPIITRIEKGVRFSRPEGRQASDVIVSLSLVPKDRLLVQYGSPFRGMSNPEDIVDVTSVIFSKSNGRVRERRNDLPRIDYTTSVHGYSHVNDPFPRVALYQWR